MDDVYPYEVVADLTGEQWAMVLHLLQTRSGNRCEARTVDCLAAAWRGELWNLNRRQISLHHRAPRKMGGAKNDDRVNTLSRLMLLCGTGTTGCHGWIESNRDLARDNGWLIPRLTADRIHSDRVPMLLAGRRMVLLDDLSPLYLSFTHV